MGEELMRNVERFLLLQIIDQRWQEHLYDMDYLQQGIHLRGFAQIEPLVAYKNEAFELFRDLMNSIWGDFARLIFHVEVTVQDENGNAAAAGPAAHQPGRAARPPAAAGSATRAGAAHSPAPWPWRPPTRARRSTCPRPTRRWLRRSSSAGSTRPIRSAATTRAGAARARNSRSATAPEPPAQRRQRPASPLLSPA